MNSNAIDLCHTMRANHNYANMVILADSLQEDDYDQEIVDKCRANPDTIDAARIVCLVLGGEYANAVKSMEDLASSTTLTYREVIEGAKRYMETGEMFHGGAEYEGMNVGHEFWEHYELITGNNPGGKYQGGLFTCSC